MALDSGSATFRMMELPRPFPTDWPARFAALAAPPLDGLTEKEVRGWVTGRHLLDTRIDEDSALCGGWVHLQLRSAQKKVPAALLRAECRMEELVVQAAESRPFLKATERAEIRRTVNERLLPSMPPTLKAIPFLHRPSSRFLFTAATSETQMDAFAAFLAHTLSYNPVPSTPEALLASLRRTDHRDLSSDSFSPEMPTDAMEPALGREFLTWLWYSSDVSNGQLSLSDSRVVAILLEGPLTFVHEGDGAFVTVLRNGLPQLSLEAKSALLGGKKLKSAKLTLSLDEERIWSFTVDADTFTFRSMKVPRVEGEGILGRFEDRMLRLEEFREIWLDLYARFLDLRLDAPTWRKTVRAIRSWVAARPANR